MALRGSLVARERTAPTRAVDRAVRAPRAVLGAASVAATVVWGAAWGVPGAGIAVVIALGGLAALVDLRDGRLPDALTIAGGVVAAVSVAAAAVQHGPTVVAAAAAGCLVLTGPILAVHLASPAAMGFGDVKLGAVLGMVAGLLGWRWALFALALASGATLVVAALTGRRAVPFGPGLVAGATTSATIAWISTITDGGPLGWEVATWR